MNTQERQVIDDLFAKLTAAERRAPGPDPEAQAVIQDRVSRQPGAPYLMAQTIVMQDYALRDAEQRIEALQREVADARTQRPAMGGDQQGAGGFLSGLFGGGAGRALTPAGGDRQPEAAGAGQGGAGQVGAGQGGPGGLSGLMNRGGGGFLAGAAQTAMGVAGGMALGHAVSGLFGGSAKAGEEQGSETSPWAGQETGDAEDGGDAFGGGDEY